MSHETHSHRPEHGDDDIDIAAITTVVLSGAAILLVLILGVRVLVRATTETQVHQKVVEPRYHRLSDHVIEQRLLLEEYGKNPDGKTGRVPIERAMEMVVQQHQSQEAQP